MKFKNIYKQKSIALLMCLGLASTTYGQRECTTGICEVNDLVVQNGYTLTVSDKYHLGEGEFFTSRGAGFGVVNQDSRTIIIWRAPGNAELELLYGKSNQFLGYSQRIKIPSIIYDTFGLGELIAPFLANSTCKWFLDEVYIPETNGWKLVPKYAGTYKAVITWPKSSSGNLRLETTEEYTTELIFELKKLVTPLGLTDGEKSASLSIYPNPASESLFIETEGSYEYSILDISGNISLSGNATGPVQVDIQTLKRGAYFIEISNEMGVMRKKVIVK